MPPGVCQTLAAVSVLENYEDDTKVSYISYVENGTLYPANIITGSTVAETKSRLEMVIRETTKPLDIINVEITRADCERVKLHSGKPMWEKTEIADDIRGFTLTTKAGATFTANVPEYLRMPLFLDGYLRMFTPHTVSADEIEQEAHIKAAAERLLKDWK